MMEWEEKVNRTENKIGVIPEMLKIAALVEMLPAEIKDMVRTQPEEHQNYPKLKQKIFSWTANKIPLDKRPVSMDIGAMSYRCGQCGDEEGEVDLGAIRGSCYRCGGWGQRLRDTVERKRERIIRECEGEEKGRRSREGRRKMKRRGRQRKGKGKGIPGDLLEVRTSRA
jgi:hypothetical protein